MNDGQTTDGSTFVTDTPHVVATEPGDSLTGTPAAGSAGGNLVVLTTTGSAAEAQKIASALVERRLAGCVQVLGPMTSTYWWQGAAETAEEWLCLVKTAETHYPAVEQAIRDLHSYDLPEILALPVATGSTEYLQWLCACLA